MRKDGEEVDDTFRKYQEDMLEALGEIRQDANAIGWYESTHHGNFLNEAFIENQYMFQKAVPNAIVLVYDPFAQKTGQFGFKAFRLTNEAMEKKASGGEDEFQQFPSDRLLLEIPIFIHSSPLIDTFLLQYCQEHATGDVALDTDNIASATEKNVQLLLDSVDEFQIQQRELSNYERQTRAAKEKIMKGMRAPKTIDSLNLSQQIQKHCKGLDGYAQESYGKLELMGGLDGKGGA